MNQVLQAPSAQGDGITSDARPHYRGGGGREMRLSFSPGRSKRASRNQRAEAPRRILRAAATLARLSARLHSSAPGAAFCIAAAGWHPEQKPVPRGFSQRWLQGSPPASSTATCRPSGSRRDACGASREAPGRARTRAGNLPRPSPGEA